MTRILILGGTTEASALAAHLAAMPGIEAILSLAGRTANPKPSPVTVRTGGFGGAAGLAAWLKEHDIDLLLDATAPLCSHHFRKCGDACQMAGVPLLALERPAWEAVPGDRWIEVSSAGDAVAALPDDPATVSLVLGAWTLAAFEAAPRHRYIARVIDPPEGVINLPQLELVYGRGPFTAEADAALFIARGIAQVVAKNAGGTATVSKITAARTLGLPVVMISRPYIPARETAGSVGEGAGAGAGVSCRQHKTRRPCQRRLAGAVKDAGG